MGEKEKRIHELLEDVELDLSDYSDEYVAGFAAGIEAERERLVQKRAVEDEKAHDIRVLRAPPARLRYVVCFSCDWPGTGMVPSDVAYRAAQEHAIQTTRQVYA